jgi:hypothetical protein
MTRAVRNGIEADRLGVNCPGWGPLVTESSLGRADDQAARRRGLGATASGVGGTAKNEMIFRSPSGVRVDGCFRTAGLLKNSFLARMTSHQEALVDFVIKRPSFGNK